MTDEIDWITVAIKTAREQNGSAPDAVWTQIEAFLRGILSEGPLSAKELGRIAMLLIDVMAANSDGLGQRQ
jgi:hypothetical protein